MCCLQPIFHSVLLASTSPRPEPRTHLDTKLHHVLFCCFALHGAAHLGRGAFCCCKPRGTGRAGSHPAHAWLLLRTRSRVGTAEPRRNVGLKSGPPPAWPFRTPAPPVAVILNPLERDLRRKGTLLTWACPWSRGRSTRSESHRTHVDARGVWVLTVPAESPEVGLAVTLLNFSVMGFPGDFRIAEPVERKLTGWLRASREAVGVEPLLL